MKACSILPVILLVNLAPVSSSSPADFSAAWKLPSETTAVITGGSKGIGKACVEELAGALGIEIFTCCRNQEDLDNCLKEWDSNGWNVKGVTADVASEEGRQAFVKEIDNWLGGRRLDILVNNVGTNIRKASVDYTDKDVEFIWQTNFRSFFSLTCACHGFLKRKRKDGATFTSSVVNIGSVAGVTCMKSGS